ncbi:DUF6508 domain-containing protein [Facivitalis istanbulensis]|jgi:hypothetical protein|uniref:DUF6508 domain-containing protein n=1 Tax=Facivitalis istanbulensis TaxID=3075838 RepID=UPI00387B9652
MTPTDLRLLRGFAPILAAPDSTPGHWAGGDRWADGTIAMAFFALSPDAMQCVRTVAELKSLEA